MRLILCLFILVFTGLISCSAPNEGQDSVLKSDNDLALLEIPSILERGLEAHGGVDRWKTMKALSFSFQRDETIELQKIALDSRKAFIQRDTVQVGYDGDQVWVAPNKAAFGKSSARFYHNLIFYFYAMPFVLADPGINYELLPDRIINNKSYQSLKVSYKNDVGDAPDDYYIAHFDRETSELYLLLYTVTYFQGAPNDKFNALVYDEWQEVNGIKLPKKMVGYTFENDSLGTKRYERIFDKVELSENEFPVQIFKQPAVSEIDSLIQR